MFLHHRNIDSPRRRSQSPSSTRSLHCVGTSSSSFDRLHNHLSNNAATMIMEIETAAVANQQQQHPKAAAATDAEEQQQQQHHDISTSSSSSLSTEHTSPTAASANHNNNNNKSHLGITTLAVVVFYSVSGGPFGCEESVRSAGNFYTLLGFIIAPLIWSVQEASMTAELATAFPESSGGMAWVEEAFGPCAGWMAGYLGWVAGATDNAIYPVLFLDYLTQMMNPTTTTNDDNTDETTTPHDPMLRFIGLSLTSIFLSYINWLGLDVVGKMSVTICCIAMSPFVVMTLVGMFQMDISNWWILPDGTTTSTATAGIGGILWRPFLNNLFWNLNSFDAAASFSADVGPHPEKVIPQAMGYATLGVVLAYLFPLAVAMGAATANTTQEEWVDGYLIQVAGEIAGPWLEGWMILAAGISNIALFQAELSADAFQLMGMADRGHLPAFFSQRSRHGTPTYGILLGTAVIVFMGVSGLDKLIEMLNFNYAISLLMEYLAFLKLRVDKPNLVRPWRIPLSTFGCALLFAPTIILTLTIMVLSTNATFAFSIAVNMVGLSIYVSRHFTSIKAFWNQYQAAPTQQQEQERQCGDDEDEENNKENALPTTTTSQVELPVIT